MDSIYVTPAVAADAAADAAIGNIRKQKELEMELLEIDKQWMCARKQIIFDKLDLMKELDRIARVKVHRDYFKDHLRKANLHHYTTKARSKMRHQQYLRTHDNFNFSVDPLGKQVVPEPMIMEGDEKEGREAVTSTSLDKKRAKHIRGLSELEVKVRRFRVPRAKKKKKEIAQPPPLPDKIKRLKKVKIVQFDEIPEEVNSSDEENEEESNKPTSISITHHGHESDQETFARTSVFTIPGEKVPFARAFIPLPTLPLTPEPSFVQPEDESHLSPPKSPLEITTPLLSPSRTSRAPSPRPHSPIPPSSHPPRSPRARSPNPPRSPRHKLPSSPKSPRSASPKIQKSPDVNKSVWKFPEIHQNSEPNISENLDSYEGVKFVLPPIRPAADDPIPPPKKSRKKGGKKNKTKRELDPVNASGPVTAVEIEDKKSQEVKISDVEIRVDSAKSDLSADGKDGHKIAENSDSSHARDSGLVSDSAGKLSHNSFLPVIDNSALVQQKSDDRPHQLSRKQKGLANLTKSFNNPKRKSRKLSTVREEC